MRLEIGVMHKLARADSCAVDHEVEFCIDIFELFEADVRVDFAASLAKARGEVIEINRSVHQRDAQRETALEDCSHRAVRGPSNRPQAALLQMTGAARPAEWPNLEFQFHRCAKIAAIR